MYLTIVSFNRLSLSVNSKMQSLSATCQDNNMGFLSLVHVYCIKNNEMSSYTWRWILSPRVKKLWSTVDWISVKRFEQEMKAFVFEGGGVMVGEKIVRRD